MKSRFRAATRVRCSIAKRSGSTDGASPSWTTSSTTPWSTATPPGGEKCSAERDALIAELKRATGLGGRPRRSGSPAEKARLNVTRTIRHAITDLSTTVPELAAHLDESIVTGVSCCYEPRINIAWTT